MIEAILKIEDEALLRELEAVAGKNNLKVVGKKSFQDLAGLWTEEEANEIEKAIEAGCGQIHPDDWK